MPNVSRRFTQSARCTFGEGTDDDGEVDDNNNQEMMLS